MRPPSDGNSHGSLRFRGSCILLGGGSHDLELRPGEGCLYSLHLESQISPLVRRCRHLKPLHPAPQFNAQLWQRLSFCLQDPPLPHSRINLPVRFVQAAYSAAGVRRAHKEKGAPGVAGHRGNLPDGTGFLRY